MSAPTEVRLDDYDPRAPKTAHEGLTAALYGQILAPAESVLDVAAGNTDLAADLLGHRITGPKVTSLDAMEGYTARGYHPNRVYGYAQDLPFKGESFSMSVCQYGAQHMSDGVLGAALREMVRVTQTADNEHDDTKGVILLGPVYRKRQLENAIENSGLGEIVGTLYHEDNATSLPTAEMRKHTQRPSLWIHKLEALTPDRLEEVVDIVVGTSSLKPTRRTLGEVASRAFGGFSWR
jgi:SAM-dependent methyltransferase